MSILLYFTNTIFLLCTKLPASILQKPHSFGVESEAKLLQAP